MTTNSEKLTAWKALRVQWQEANQNAATARADVAKAFRECYSGRGSGPTNAQFDEVDRLESLAARLSAEVDAFVHKCVEHHPH
ncbi:MAG: hypothetical protein JSR59_18965 [Proteobacteria bacterium]|nr:hypothetical protein [Pseudomonadota bacterium]